MRGLGILLIAATALSACNRAEKIAFDGQFYRSSISKIDGSRSEFFVSATPVSNSITGALEAVRYEATRHCITNFGNSSITWEIGPDNDPESYTITNDTLTLRASCEE